MKIIVTHSLDPDTGSAADELIADSRARLGGAHPSAGVVYAAMDIDHPLLMRRLTEAFPDLELIGCTTDGELSGQGGFHEDSVVLVLFSSEGITIRSGVGRRVSVDPAAAAAEAIAMARRPGDPPAKLCVALPDGLTVSGTTITDALQAALGNDVILVGGTAGDQRQFEACWLLVGGEVIQDAVPLLLFSGPLSVGIGLDSGWQPIGQRAQITASQGNVVTRIEDRTALSFYQHYIGEHVIPDLEFPLMIHEVDGGRSYMRAPMVVDEDLGSIQFAGDVPVGACVQITEASREELIQACASSVQAAFADLGDHPADGALVFSCAARRMVLGTRTMQEVKMLVETSPVPLPIAGFYTYGEIAAFRQGDPARFHNETFVTVLLSES